MGSKMDKVPDTRPLTPSPADEAGRRIHADQESGEIVYGEPKGPRPPHFDILPKPVIERRAAEKAPRLPPSDRGGTERLCGRFASGMVSAETFETASDRSAGSVSAHLERNPA